ncbi:MAG: PhoPQ-activated pathogenicity-related family protein [Acidobacteriales bacterium]|nr:PhoPQ-activated pathogenicity-related family protein [Terriglobales bacterium]
MTRNNLGILTLALAALLCQPALCGSKTPGRTALDDYVAKPDPHFHWECKERVDTAEGAYYLLAMTSQQWRTEQEVTHSVWTHWLSIYKPAKVTSPIGLLTINGGSVASKPRRPDARSIEIAALTGSVVAELRGVPNEPVKFAGDPSGPRTEDGIIAYTWDKFLKTGDGTWPLRLPMTKSAVRAMDAVTEFVMKEAGVNVERYVVAGASKRGWTTWTTAAVDKRVVAAAPIVIDTLNLVNSFVHHYRVYGFWAPSVYDYFAMGLMDALHHPRYGDLARIEDPYCYRDRLTMPKYIVNSTGDQFFLPDSSQFYFDDLKGEKYLRYIPNTDHSLRGSDVWQTLTAFYNAILNNQSRPRFDWKSGKDGSIRVTTAGAPSAVKLWQGTNPKHRDFRLEAVGPIFKSTDLQPVKKGIYVAKVDKPASGWTAYFVELTFPSSIKYPFKFTTPIRVTPDVLPFAGPVPGKTRLGPQKQVD